MLYKFFHFNWRFFSEKKVESSSTKSPFKVFKVRKKSCAQKSWVFFCYFLWVSNEANSKLKINLFSSSKWPNYKLNRVWGKKSKPRTVSVVVQSKRKRRKSRGNPKQKKLGTLWRCTEQVTRRYGARIMIFPSEQKKTTNTRMSTKRPRESRGRITPNHMHKHHDSWRTWNENLEQHNGTPRWRERETEQVSPNSMGKVGVFQGPRFHLHLKCENEQTQSHKSTLYLMRIDELCRWRIWFNVECVWDGGCLVVYGLDRPIDEDDPFSLSANCKVPPTKCLMLDETFARIS